MNEDISINHITEDLESFASTERGSEDTKGSVDSEDTNSAAEPDRSDDTEEIKSIDDTQWIRDIIDRKLIQTINDKNKSDEEKCHKDTRASLEQSSVDLFSNPDYCPLAEFFPEKGDGYSSHEEIIEQEANKIGDSLIAAVSSSISGQEASIRPKSISINTIKYDLKPKSSVLSGDFKGLRKSDDELLLLGAMMSIQSEDEEQLLEVKGEELPVNISEENFFDRRECYEKMKNIRAFRTNLIVLNSLLQRKIALYFKKRLKDHVLNETLRPVERLHYMFEYLKKLDTYERLLQTKANQYTTMETQIKNLKMRKETKQPQLENMCHDMSNREIHIGRGLILRKTGKVIPDWLIDQYINRQTICMTNLSELRKEFIKLKTMVTEKVQAIAKLDKVDQSHNLKRYLKLVEENEFLRNKDGKNEQDLIRLRKRSMETLECLAHIREKCAAVYSDNEDLISDKCRLEKISMDLRRMISSTNREKHKYRSLAGKLKEESGLLQEPKLLKDMEDNKKLREELKGQLEDLKTQFADTSKSLENIKRCIRSYDVSKQSKVAIVKQSRRKIVGKSIKCKSSPMVFNSVLPNDASLEICKPNVRKITIQ